MLAPLVPLSFCRNWGKVWTEENLCCFWLPEPQSFNPCTMLTHRHTLLWVLALMYRSALSPFFQEVWVNHPVMFPQVLSSVFLWGCFSNSPNGRHRNMIRRARISEVENLKQRYIRLCDSKVTDQKIENCKLVLVLKHEEECVGIFHCLHSLFGTQWAPISALSWRK